MIHHTDESLFFKRNLEKMHPGLRVTQTNKIAHLIPAMVRAESPNLKKLATCLPHTGEPHIIYQWIWRFLDNDLVVPEVIMSPYARKILNLAARKGRRIVLVIDQSQLTRKHRHEVLSVSVRVGGRALPLFWHVKQTSGGIGWREQRELLELVLDALPKGSKQPVLMGDRFYGSVAMIAWLKARGWSYRLRLKASLVVFQEGGEITLRECVRLGVRELVDVQLTRRKVETHIGIVHEKGHEEPWIIAMDCKPNEYKTLDYGMRWGIECMHSDLKTRAFNVEDSQLKDAGRLSRLLLIMALALFWAVSTGMHHALHHMTANEKRAPGKRSANHARSKLSFMTRGLRHMQWAMRHVKKKFSELVPGLFREWIPDGA